MIRLLKNLIKLALRTESYRWSKNKLIVSVKPSFISLAVSETCFFRCKHCDIWKLKAQKDWMKYEQMKKAIKKLHRWLGDFSLTFSGGEPFLNNDLIRLSKYADNLGISVHVNTNGWLFDYNLIKKVSKARFNSIHVSVDGIWPDS